jgi:hypothetical protein
MHEHAHYRITPRREMQLNLASYTGIAGSVEKGEMDVCRLCREIDCQGTAWYEAVVYFHLLRRFGFSSL